MFTVIWSGDRPDDVPHAGQKLVIYPRPGSFVGEDGASTWGEVPGVFDETGELKAEDGTSALELKWLEGLEYTVRLDGVTDPRKFTFPVPDVDETTLDLADVVPVLAPGPLTPYLRGEKGADGAPGNDGADGTDGTDGADGATGAQGPAGATGATGAQGEPGFPRGGRVVTMGDSINATGTSAAHGTMWTSAMCELSDQRMLFVGNAAYGGETSTQAVTRIAEALSYNPQIVTLTAGANDLSSLTPLATYQANITTIADAMAAAGVRLVLTTITPLPTLGVNQNQIGQWNLWLKQFAAARSLDIFDFHALLADPVTGGFKAGMDSGDGIHPSQIAHIAMADVARAAIINSVPAGSMQAPVSAGENANANTLDPGNMVKNPMLAYGTPTPTNYFWTPAAGAVGTLVTDAAFRGKAFQVQIAGGASGGLSQFTTASIPVVAGSRLMLSALHRVDVSTATPALFKGLRFEAWLSGAPWVIPMVQGFVAARGLARWRYELDVPAGITSLNLVTLVNAITAGENYTVHLGEYAVRTV